MHGSGLHLPNTFAGQPEGLPDLRKGLLVTIRHPESPTKDFPFSGRERLQDRLTVRSCVSRASISSDERPS